MAEVRGFRAFRYDSSVAGNMVELICPPYDVIDPAMQLALHEKSKYNMVRVEYGLIEPGDSPERNKYTRAGAALEKWVEQGVLLPDNAPSMYLHHHIFEYSGRRYTRRNLFAVVRLEEWDKGIVRPHEGTAAVFKADRLNLLRATRTNVSPVLAMYEDPSGEVASVLAEVENGKPLHDFAYAESERHVMWQVSDVKSMNRIAGVLSGRSIYVADGHHRYETGLAYRNERRAATPEKGGNAAFDFIMMSLIDLAESGVVVLPTHRMVRGISPEVVNSRLEDRLSEYFVVRSVPVEGQVSAAMRALAGDGKRKQVVCGIAGLEKDRLVILQLRDPSRVAHLMPADRSQAYCKLDVAVLHHVVLQHLLGVSEGDSISYTRSEEEAWRRVSVGEFQFGFLLGPVDTRAITAVADAAD
ncbi:MAG: DUF1015 domain-containing protein, partial [Dehalococcoidia bacterium]|nr:DUF1015 domain-containing protein [Dehalococcoidia bacterium]